MPGKIARFILAFSTFPLIGAYGLRWVGGFVASVIAATGLDLPGLALLDLLGGIVGLVLGIMLAIQNVGCCFQPETLPVRPVADNILILLATVLIIDVALPRAFPGAEWLKWVPPVNLVIWSGAAAATASLSRMRRQWRERMVPPTPPPAAPPTAPSPPWR